MNYLIAISVYALAMILAVSIIKAFKVQSLAVCFLIGIPLGAIASSIAMPLVVFGL